VPALRASLDRPVDVTGDLGDGWADYCYRLAVERDEAEERGQRYLTLLELEIRKVVAMRDELARYVDLLRNHKDPHSPYALACRDIAHLIDDVLEKHQ
jgi:hypothetical protein